MQNQHFQNKNLNPLLNSLEKPVKELMELNVKMFQGLSYLTPAELLKAKKPEEIMEKNVEIFILNSHKLLDYSHDMFGIMEKHWLNMSSSINQNTKEMMNQGQKVARENMTDALETGKRAATTVTSGLKKAARKNVKQAKSAARKSTEALSAKKETSGTKKVKAKSRTSATGSVKQQARKASSSVKAKTKAKSNAPKSAAKPDTSAQASKMAASSSQVKPVNKEVVSPINRDRI